ncbi:hypothetical protein O0L34_g16899 [Tuta absoluta]|nr:hypothetical protein O0L34_g16899 [Tuta absoluta]
MESGKKAFWKCDKCSKLKTSTPNQVKATTNTNSKPTKSFVEQNPIVQPTSSTSSATVTRLNSPTSSVDNEISSQTATEETTTAIITSCDLDTTLTPIKLPCEVRNIIETVPLSNLPKMECACPTSVGDDPDPHGKYCISPQIDITLHASEPQQIDLPASIEAVTHRKKNTVVVNVATANSFESLSSSIQSDSDDEDEMTPSLHFRGSCPELNNVLKQSELENLRERVVFLEEQLASADCEIANMLSENCALKDEVARHIKRCDLLGKLCLSTSDKKTHAKSIKNKTMPLILNSKTENLAPHVPTEKATSASLVINPIPIPTCKSSSVSPPTIPTKKTIPSPADTIKHQREKDLRPEICLLSTDRTNKVLSAAKKVFPGEYNFCYYNMTNCGSRQLLSGIEAKLKNLTMMDYCVVLLSEEDFHTTNNYFDLVSSIREALEPVKNTNVILCSPAYKHEKFTNLYNSRVECFNKLLCRDIELYEYAYLIDSNKNLEYDFSMFSSDTGCLNGNGMHIVFKDIINTISMINENFEIQVFREHY